MSEPRMADYIMLFSFLLFGGFMLSLPLIFVRPYVDDWFYILFFSVVVIWFALDNWTLVQDLNRRNEPIEWYIAQKHDHLEVIGELTAQNALLTSVNQSLLRSISTHRHARVRRSLFNGQSKSAIDLTSYMKSNGAFD